MIYLSCSRYLLCFLYIAEWYYMIWMNYILLVEGNFGSSHSWVIISKALWTLTACFWVSMAKCLTYESTSLFGMWFQRDFNTSSWRSSRNRSSVPSSKSVTWLSSHVGEQEREEQARNKGRNNLSKPTAVTHVHHSGSTLQRLYSLKARTTSCALSI